MLITYSTLCFTIINGHVLCPTYLFILSDKTVIYISTIIYQFSDGTLNKYFLIWNIWASRVIYFRFTKSKLQYFGYWHQKAISWGNIGRGSQCGTCKIDMGGRGESRGHGCGKLPGSTGRPWSHYEGGVGLDTFTRENYHKIAFVRESRRVHQVAVLKLNT